MMWAGLAIIPVGLILVALNAPRAVDIGVLVLLFATAFTGLGVVLYGNHVGNRDVDEYRRKAAEGEIRPGPASGRGTTP
jgi:hypothetical protein